MTLLFLFIYFEFDVLQESGNVWINTYNLIPPGLPFGGSKWSGFGRENCAQSLDAYSEVKTTYVQL